MLLRRRDHFKGNGNEIAGLIFHLPLTENLIDVVGGKNIVWQQSNFNPSFSAEGMFLPQSMMAAYSTSDIIPQINGQSLTISFFTKTLAKRGSNQVVCAFSTVGSTDVNSRAYATTFLAAGSWEYLQVQQSRRSNNTDWGGGVSIFPYNILQTYHIVSVYEWTGTNFCSAKTYIDGVLQPNSQVTVSLQVSPLFNQTHFFIGGGAVAYTGNGLVGYLRDVKIFNRALNDDEILNL